jgi:hypothetical protein
LVRRSHSRTVLSNEAERNVSSTGDMAREVTLRNIQHTANQRHMRSQHKYRSGPSAHAKQLVVTSGPMAGLPVAVALEVSQIVIVV